MSQLFFSLFNNTCMPAKTSNLEFRSFPDGETYLKFDEDLSGHHVVFIDSLNNPNEKVLPLIFAGETAKSLGAKSVTLCAPYLAYMRQDKQFQPGEAVTSEHFAKLISQHFDRLITVDPHLHRHHKLDEIYSIPTKALHAEGPILDWLKNNVKQPVIIGPDSESEQWVKKLAKLIDAPYQVLEKTRTGDYDVKIQAPELTEFKTYTPVLLDDIVSTANTMIKTIEVLRQAKLRPPVCIGVHAVFAGDAYQRLLDSGIDKIVTCNTILHESNQIDLSNLIRAEI